ncbi:unnamed protein product [Effrenium voratum]|nr:unnamed protein product [Effrenium voratum]
MTTNNKDALDPALLRSGRIDYELEFRAAVPDQIHRLFTRFYSDFGEKDQTATGEVSASKGTASTEQLAAQFAERLKASERNFTTADIQRHLMKRKKSPERAVQEVQELIDAFALEG